MVKRAHHLLYSNRNMTGNSSDGFISVLLGFRKEVLVVCIELLFNLCVLSDQVALLVFQMGYSIDVSPVYHSSVEEFCILFPLFEPLHPRFLPP
jgi:hypothetical protein